jgi:succinate dehydrogenase / fumarate reductase cytochrome b subunit
VSALQVGFAVALTALFAGVVAFTASTVRGALVTGDAGAAGWIERLGRAHRHEAQRWAFVAHRVTGVAVFAFLALHVFDVALYALSPARFDDVHRLYGTAPMRAFESLLLYGILFHTCNGLRLVLLDVAELGAATARRLLDVSIATTVVLGTPAAAVILRPVLP